VQLVDGVKVPVELVVKLTVPVGVVGLASMSVTVAVHVDGVPTWTAPGEHVTVVAAEWGGTVTARTKDP